MTTLGPRALALLLLASAPSSAQDLWVVAANGTGDFTQIQDAVDAASSGDRILVRSGFYGNKVTIDGKSLEVFGDVGAEVALAPFAAEGEALLRVQNLAADQSVTLRGLDLTAQQLHFVAQGIDLLNNAGAVWIQDVRVEMFNPFSSTLGGVHAVQVTASDSVVLVDCDVRGDRVSAGLVAMDSSLFVFGSEVEGGPGHQPDFDVFLSAGSGAELVGSYLFASGSTFKGGKGVDGLIPCPVNESEGGDGVRMLEGAPALEAVGSTFIGGLGGLAGPFCPPGTPGAPNGLEVSLGTGTFQDLAGSARSVSTSAAVREGETFSQTFSGEPGELFFVALSPRTLPAFPLPSFLGALVLGQPQVSLFLGTLDGVGSAQVDLLIAELGAGVEAVPLFALPAFFDAQSFALTIGAPSTTLLLDQSF